MCSTGPVLYFGQICVRGAWNDMASSRNKRGSDQYSEKEARQRFEAALHGGLNTLPKSLKSMTPKRGKAQRDSDPRNREPRAVGRLKSGLGRNNIRIYGRVTFPVSKCD